MPGVAQHLRARLDAATDWTPGDPLPAAALLCHDGMGMAGPSRAILAQAHAQRHATLFTGHVPEGSLGAHMLAGDSAHWIRLPTHPTRTENEAMARATRAPTLLGHSCDRGALARLAALMPTLRDDVATGDRLDLG
jgi:hypothetical protein